MDGKHVTLPCSYLEEMDALNDAEFGRLIRGLLEYGKTGKRVHLEGNERFYLRRVMAQEDERRAQESEKQTQMEKQQGDCQISAVVDAYLNKVNPSASHMCLQELVQYAQILGTEVCLRAMDTALDEGRHQWSYIRSILQRCTQQGIRSLADWDAAEAQRGGGQRGRTGNAFLDILRRKGGVESDGRGDHKGPGSHQGGLPELPAGAGCRAGDQSMAFRAQGSPV